MVSMRAMALENRIDEEVERFASLKEKLDEIVKPDVLAEDNVAWLYGEKDDEDWRDEDVEQDDQIAEVKQTLLELLDSVYTLEGLLYTRGVLMN